MLFAKRENGLRGIPMKSGERGTCPACDGAVLGRCGRINAPHWAHRASDCDTWHEPESWWHLEWKERFPVERTEVPIRLHGRMHRADVLLTDGRVLELQSSPISVAEIEARERFYKGMVWLFDVREPFRLGRISIREKGGLFTFRWKRARKHIAYCTRPVYLDFGCSVLFHLWNLYPEAPVGGVGMMTTVMDAFPQFRLPIPKWYAPRPKGAT